MPPRRRKPVAVSGDLPKNGLLDWSGSEHFSTDARPCRYCGTPTHLRDSQGRPADKVCAEIALAEVAQVLATYGSEERL